MGQNALTDLLADKGAQRIYFERQKILDAFAEELECPVNAWGKIEWKAVTMTILTEKIELGFMHDAAMKVADELWSLKDVLSKDNYVLSDRYKDLLKTYRPGGTPKKGKEYEPKSSVRKICAHIQSMEFVKVLEALQNAELCNDLYESTSEPIGVLFTAVDENKETISFMRRGSLPDNQDDITFKRLRGILTEIKK